MKKTLIITLSLLISSYTFCQTPSSFDREEVVEVKNTKAKLYANAQTWIAKTFGDYKAVIQFEDKEQGRLIIKGTSKLGVDESFSHIRFTLTINIKDDKYKYEITDVGIAYYDRPTDYKDAENLITALLKQTTDNINRLTALPTDRMRKKELKEYEADVNRTKEVLKDINDVKSKIISDLEGLTISLKIAMKSNDDF